MLYRDLFTDTNPTAVYFSLYADDAAAIFGDLTADNLTPLLLGKYGDRVLLKYITTDTYEEYLTAFIQIRAGDYKSLYDVLNADYDVLNPVQETTTRTTTTTSTRATTSKDLSAGKAFNSTKFLNDERHRNTGTSNEQNDVIYKNIRVGVGDNSSYFDTIKKERELKAQSLQHYIINELINCITLKLY